MDIIEKDGKPVFVGKEDPLNPPVFVKDPMKRYCSKCRGENGNDRTECIKCGSVLDDGKMQCPTCKRWFDYLLGDVQLGCEGCYDKNKDFRKESHDRPVGEIFD